MKPKQFEDENGRLESLQKFKEAFLENRKVSE